jgi:two-component system, OmpR family, sensor kinase
VTRCSSARLPHAASRSALRRLGETLNQMLDRLRQAFERERRFVADASHELRTPLAVVKTELEGALRTGDYGPRVRDGLLAAIDECDRLGQLAEDLLVIARATDGQLPLRPEQLEVRSVLDSICLRFADRVRSSAVASVLKRPTSYWFMPIPSASAKRSRSWSTTRFGMGRARSRSVRSGWMRASASKLPTKGTGFPRELAEHAFERFARGDRARTRGGAGLGMAIVREIAAAHGGSSEIVAGGHSTRVRLWLPDSPPGQPDADPVAASGMPTASSGR